MQTKTALQLLTWTQDTYGGGKSEYAGAAMLNHRQIAHISDCPAGWSVRIWSVPWNVRGAHQVFDTYEQARAYIELWVSGLDIDPGPETEID